MKRVLLAMGLMLVAATPAAAARTFTLDLTFDAYFGGMHGLKATLKAERDGDRYMIESHAESQGMIDRFVHWRSHRRTVGVWQASGPEPRIYRFQSDSRWGPRHVATDFLPDGRVQNAYYKKGKIVLVKTSRVPIPKGSLTGSLDLATAIVAATVEPSAGASPCGRTFPVFDGQQRYDAHLIAAGRDNLAKSDYSIYHGAAVKCRVTITPIGGFTREWLAETAAHRAKGEDDLDITVWFAADKTRPLFLPVRAEARNWLGWLVIHTTAFRYVPSTTMAAE